MQDGNFDESGDAPKAMSISFIFKIASKLMAWLFRRYMIKEANDANDLQRWKNILIQNRNSRVDALSMAHDAELLASAQGNSSTSPSKADPSDS